MISEKIRARLDALRNKEYRKQRHDGAELEKIAYADTPMDFVRYFERACEIAYPIIHGDDEFGFCISSAKIIKSPNGNITPNYYRLASDGFDKTREMIKKSAESTSDTEKLEYARAMIATLDICERVAREHRECAKAHGAEKLYRALEKIPAKPADNFYEALVFVRMMIYFLRVGFGSHLGLGRFDKYMYPFYLKDRALGVSDEEIYETLLAFFISLNYDSDIYQGIQQGDNGQSMVLGGTSLSGESEYNELSEMCLRASLELDLIDPKINLRVNKNTPMELYKLGTELTRRGLGFPQYSNDDVVIPGLISLGYEPEDAANYTVAACWEFIIPHCSADIPNRGTFDFPGVVNSVVTSSLTSCTDFDSLMTRVRSAIAEECANIRSLKNGFKTYPNPLMSVMTDGCIEELTDLWVGAKYRNYGCHGAGIANAADALAAIKLYVFEKQSIDAHSLLDALARNFEGCGEMRDMLASAPKMGCNDDYVDSIAADIMLAFSDNMNLFDNGVGGIWRAGTGSAMEYIWKGEKCPATADGRLCGDPYSSSFSPSLDTKCGLLSVIQSFTKFDMRKIINGGPLTVEIHDSTLRGDMGIEKVAMVAKSFIDLGGHQLQLNSVSRERLLDAQAHPEKYPGLIVRVWGWSGYFNELDIKYQNHIIRRVEHTV